MFFKKTAWAIELISIFNLNFGMRLYYWYRSRSRKKKSLLGLLKCWKTEEKISNLLTGKIKLLNRLPGYFLEIGLVLDIWDFEAGRWPMKALAQVADHYGVTDQEALAKYDIIVTPFLDWHGKVWARPTLN